MLLTVAAGIKNRHVIHIRPDLLHSGPFQRLAAVEAVHQLIAALLTLPEDNRLFQAGLFDAGNQAAVILSGGVLNISARERLNVRKFDIPQVLIFRLLRRPLFVGLTRRGGSGSLGLDFGRFRRFFLLRLAGGTFLRRWSSESADQRIFLWVCHNVYLQFSFIC